MEITATTPRDEYPKVAGYCPMGCDATLSLGVGGQILCSNPNCPNPTAVSTLLTEHTGAAHTVEISNFGIRAIRHPLREHLDDTACSLPDKVAALPAAVIRPGVYRVHWPDHGNPGGWSWVPADPDDD